jgi:site-specific recombinase XerD
MTSLKNYIIEVLLCEARKKSDPKVGTGKKPKGSGRRLYTDENPKDTVSVKFRTVTDIRNTLSKKSFKAKSHARQSQIINLIHQRVRAAYKNAKDPKVKARLKKAYEYAKERKEASKRKTKRLNKQKKKK